MTIKQKSMNHGRTVSLRFVLNKNLLYSLPAVFFVFLLSSLQAQSHDENGWQQFRGYSGSGIINSANIPDVLPEGGPDLLWSLDVGNGFPEVTVSGDFAYIFSSDSLDGGYEYVSAHNANTGEELWKTKVDSMWLEIDGWGHGPRSTPAVDDDKLFCLSGFGKFSALSLKDGKKLWTVDLPAEFGSPTPRWGFSSSPVIFGDAVVIETGGTEGRAFTAFEKSTGKIKWSKGAGVTTYCSPALVTIDGQHQIVFANDSMLTAYNTGGEELWAFRMPLRMPTAMPVFMEPNRFFVSSVSRTGGFVVEIDNNKPEQLFTSTTMQNNWSSSCYLDGYLYGFSKAKLQCVNAETGEMVWGKRGFGKGSLIIVGDKLVVMSDQGKLLLVKADPGAYQEIGSFQALEGKSWTAPAYANGKLFVRNLSKMSCYDLTKNL